MTDKILSFLTERGCSVPRIGLLQPADPFLDTAGEDLRRRIFLTADQAGASLCLRPEFTIPVCLAHVADPREPARYAYAGTVFRQRRDEPAEFSQAGIEDLGDPDEAGADARSLADAMALLRHVAPAADWRVTLGDQAVFDAVIRALGLPDGWRKKLVRSFGSPEKVEGLLAALGAPRERANGLPPAISAALEAGEEPALRAAIAESMASLGFPAAVSRTPRDIAARMLEQAALDNARLGEDQIGELRDFLAIEVPLDRAGAALRAFSARLGGGMDRVLEAFEARVARIAELDVDISRIAYDAAFGRPLDYYSGLVFEIGLAGADRPVAGGGRYDRLLTLLGARQPIPGVGFSVWLDRLPIDRALKGDAA